MEKVWTNPRKYNYGRPVTDLVEENGYDNECFMFESVAEVDRTNAGDAFDHLTELLTTLTPSTNLGIEQLAWRYETLRGLWTEHILPQQYLSVARLGFFANTVSTSLSCYSCGARRDLNEILQIDVRQSFALHVANCAHLMRTCCRPRENQQPAPSSMWSHFLYLFYN